MTAEVVSIKSVLSFRSDKEKELKHYHMILDDLECKAAAINSDIEKMRYLIKLVNEEKRTNRSLYENGRSNSS